jgi:superfamily II DNA or RNA helicase
MSLFEQATFDDQLRDLALEVRDILEERGTISKTEIDALFAPTSEEYQRLRQSLASMPRVTARPGHEGGFVLKDPRRSADPDDASADEPNLNSDERAAVERLLTLLSSKELADLVGDDIRGVLRSIRRIQSGKTVDRPLRHSELAVALVVKHGNELLGDPTCRKVIGRAINQERAKAREPKVDVPGRWHPGKRAAVDFVMEAGFPPVFAGVPAGERPKDYEYLQGKVELSPLAPFQDEVRSRMLAVLRQPKGRAILRLPTGAGKTRTAVEALREWLTARSTDQAARTRNVVLWLAHTEELCEQAYACFRQVWEGSSQACPLYLFRFWGSYTSDLVAHRDTLKQAILSTSVFISTPQRFANLIKEAGEPAKRAVAQLRNGVGALVIDEAHRAAAPTYQQILERFEVLNDASVIGLTATPYRAEYAEDPLAQTFLLSRLFRGTILEPRETLGDDPRSRLQDMGVLARPVLETIKTLVRLKLPAGFDGSTVLSQEDIERGDKAPRVKADASAARRLAVTGKIVDICSASDDHSTLYFGPSVADAAIVAYLLRERGFRAAFVSGGTPEPARRQMIEDFRRGILRVLCNCEVLTTGFDAPRVTHVVVGRPTLSQVLYEQMVGRGLRGPKFGGTDTCVIVNCVDEYARPAPEFGWEGWRDAWNPAVK